MIRVAPVPRLLLGIAGSLTLLGLPSAALDRTNTPAAILQEFHRFRELGAVLYVAAHPDDENTQLIASLARGRHCRVAYLSITRGDGGQNVLGAEFGEVLGVIRTEELLAARRIDGGAQFFTRAIDFGYSKDYRETLDLWGREQVLGDVVRVIRTFRPDIVISRFGLPPQSSGHGHHTASAQLAFDAFVAAGDTNAFPEQLRELKVWQPKRLLWNIGGFGRNPAATNAPVLRLELGGEDAATGESLAAIAGQSRAMHKTQGFGNFRGPGGGPRTELFRVLAGEPATNDVFDGVDTTWARVPDGLPVQRAIDEAIAAFNPTNPAASVPAILNLRKLVNALAPDPVVHEKRVQLDGILQACLGLSVETAVSEGEIVPGEELKLQQTTCLRSSERVRWHSVRYPAIGREVTNAIDLQPNQPVQCASAQKLPADTPLTQPYWLRQDHPPGRYQVADPAFIGRPENPPVFPVEYVFHVADQELVIVDQPLHMRPAAPDRPESCCGLRVIGPVSLDFPFAVQLFAPGKAHSLDVDVTAWRSNTAGTLSLEAPAGWKITPAKRAFSLKTNGESARLTFTVTAPPVPGTAIFTPRAETGGMPCFSRHIQIQYHHIPPILLQPVAQLKAVSLDLALGAQRIGYVPGAGDNVADSIEQMGCSVTTLEGGDLTTDGLRGLDAIVIGIRAFNVRTDLVSRLPDLFAFAEAGGTVILQYNNPNGLQTNRLAPLNLRLSQQRVTDETAPVTLLAPEHPALRVPNRITSADFDGWVQERGLYFPAEWDEQFTPLLTCSDPGEAPLNGGVLVARWGKGHFVYTSLSWFRQLPSGVPGAYRLFANLLSLGSTDPPRSVESAK